MALLEFGIGLIPFRRRMAPEVTFLEPEGRRLGYAIWWHVPIVIREPNSRLRAQFTKNEIVDCEAAAIIADLRNHSIMKLQWECDSPRGGRRQTLRLNEIYTLPIAIRAEKSQAIYIDAARRPILHLTAGESFVTERRFMRRNVKDEKARLTPGQAYQFTIKLKAAKRSRWESTATYSLYVPLPHESNGGFQLLRRSIGGTAGF